MAYFAWHDEYSVGIAQVDEQHQKLVALVNCLFEAMKDGKAGSVAEAIVSELVSYTVTHFQTEETMMRLHKFPGYEAHKQKHEAMKARVLDFQSRLKGGATGVAVDLSTYLKGWLQKHIGETDKSYGPYLNSKGIH